MHLFFPDFVLHIPPNTTNYMEQSLSCEADSHSAVQENTHLSWNLNVYCHIHKSPLLDLVLNPLNNDNNN